MPNGTESLEDTGIVQAFRRSKCKRYNDQQNGLLMDMIAQHKAASEFNLKSLSSSEHFVSIQQKHHLAHMHSQSCALICTRYFG